MEAHYVKIFNDIKKKWMRKKHSQSDGSIDSKLKEIQLNLAIAINILKHEDFNHPDGIKFNKKMMRKLIYESQELLNSAIIERKRDYTEKEYCRFGRDKYYKGR